MGHDQEQGRTGSTGTELAKRTPAVEPSQEPASPTGEPTDGDARGQRQPARHGDRPGADDERGYPPGQEPPRVIDGQLEERAPR